MLSTLEEGLWDWRLDNGHLSGTEQFWNLLGLCPTEDSNQYETWLDLTHPMDHERVLQTLNKAAIEDNPVTFEARFWADNGEYLWFSVHATPNSHESENSDEGNQASHLSGWLKNINEEYLERENARVREEVFTQQQRLIAFDNMGSGIAHEFNNLLQIIRGYVTFANESLPRDSQAAQDLAEALSTTDRATEVVKNLHKITRINDDVETVIDINEELQGLQTILKPIIGKSIDVEISTSEETLQIFGVVGSLQQALLNLCINSADAMPDGGKLWLRTELFESPTRREDIGWGLSLATTAVSGLPTQAVAFPMLV